MITLMGATGATGGALLRHLVARGVPVRAVTRTPEALRTALGGSARTLVQVVGADAADPQSLRSAFAGCTQLFLAMANGPRQVELECNVLDAAEPSGVRHVVKLSAPAAEPDSPVAVSRGHRRIEDRLAASPMTGTVLRPYAFMQKLLLGAPGIAEGVLIGSLGEAACTYVDVRDIAEVAAEILLRPGLAGATHTLTGPRAYTQHQVAALLSESTGRTVRYVDLTPDAFHDHLLNAAGMPDWLARHVVEIQQLAVSRPESANRTVEEVLGRPARTLPDFLHEHRAVFTAGAAPAGPPAAP
ncbi:NAD(P)H-binding protein [Streptomyces bambusae]|uniref:NmrA family NAD(P)-binding protein n=1 Tax=Streptomyces bambusae TaxID=1550616 RepID=UPI001CFC6D59|nr:NAD(P)H-binding protein [Streptomyces bambusae]MCB5163770.1 NAD(P)H-binding protein [Streptomyces bambusae]